MENPRHWRLKEPRYRLIGDMCSHCETKFFPPRDICTNCHQNTNKPHNFNGKGEVQSYTTIHGLKEDSESNNPHTVALIELEEGPTVVAKLVELDGHKVEIGTPVEMVAPGINGNESNPSIFKYTFRPIPQKQVTIYEAPQ